MEKHITEWQIDTESAMKFKYNDVASCLSVLPTCHLLPDLTQNISFPLSLSRFFPSLRLSLCLPPSSPLSASLSVSLSRNLSYNNLTRLDEGSLAVLGDLHALRLGHNSISHITEGAFRGLKAVRIL